ncbi:MAG: serine hydrolase domain-containing protein [Cumulibacter sp.]
MAQVSGTYDPKFQSVADTLSGLIDSGQDVGASVAIVMEGKPIVDIWAGWMDQEKTRPWEQDTITNVWSTTKTVSALAGLMLIDRGLIHEDDPVAKHWPEFAANGKENVTIGHVLSHTSGLPVWEKPITLEEVYDWTTATEKLAGQAPWWEPGAASGYQAMNYGHFIGEVVRRVTGKPLAQFVAEEISGPLNADFQIGAARADYDRISAVISPPPPEPVAGLDPNSVMARAAGSPLIKAGYSKGDAWRAADIGAANGHTNARGIARVQSVVSNGGEVDGVRLLSPDTISRIFREYSNGDDLVLGRWVRFGLGYALQSADIPYIPQDGVAFWGGWGGSLVVNDIERKSTISFMMNKMNAGTLGNPSSQSIFEAAYDALG